MLIAFVRPPKQTTLRIIATDNLPSRNNARYPASELPALAAYLIGAAATVDHAWRAEKEWGTITDAGVMVEVPPTDLDDDAQKIVVSEGYRVVWVDVATDDQTVLGRMERGLNLRVSISATFSLMRCPDCDCKAGNMASYECPNMPWDVPYYDRIGVSDGLEVSLVLVPAVRSARVIGVMENE
jgi:hypothetical protein